MNRREFVSAGGAAMAAAAIPAVSSIVRAPEPFHQATFREHFADIQSRLRHGRVTRNAARAEFYLLPIDSGDIKIKSLV